MSWAFRSVGTVGTSFNASVTPGQPAGILLNDILFIATSEFFGADARPVVAGWTDITKAANWTTGAAVYAKVAVGNDTMPAIPSWGNQFQNAVCLCYSGGPNTLVGLVDTASSDKGYNSTNLISFNDTGVPVNPGSLILAISFKNTLGNGSPVFTEIGGLVGFNRRVTQWPTNTRPTLVVDDFVQGAAAAITSAGMNMNFTEASTQTSHSTILVLSPAVAGSPPPGDNEFPAQVYAAKRPSSLHEFWQVAIEILQVPPVQLPPSDLEMPAFLLRPRSNVQLGIEGAIPRPLIGKDRVLIPVDWQYGWDPPQLIAALRGIEKGFTVADLTQVTNFPPYIEYNWSVPSGPRQWNRGYEAGINLNLIGQDALPLGAFHNLQWDPPPAPRQPIANRGFEQSALSLFYTVPLKPPLCNEWPLPIRVRRPVQDYAQGTPLLITSALSVFPPFQPSQDLPSRRAPRSYALYSIETTESALLYKRDILPFGISFLDSNPRTRFNRNIYSITERSAFLTSSGPPPPVGPLGVRHVGRIVISPAKLGEGPFIPFDFISGLESASEVVVSASTTCTLYSGTDPNPGAIIVGAATVSGSIAFQKVVPTIVGNIYDLSCKAITSAGQILILDAYFAIVPGVP